MFGVHVAPPENRFNPPGETESSVVSEHLTQGCVGCSFDAVGHGRHFTFPGGIKESKQRFTGYEPVECVSCLNQTHVGIDPSSLGCDSALGKEVLPTQCPGNVVLDPNAGLFTPMNSQQAFS